MRAQRTLTLRMAKASLGLVLVLQLCPMTALATDGDAIASDDVAIEDVLPEEEQVEELAGQADTPADTEADGEEVASEDEEAAAEETIAAEQVPEEDYDEEMPVEGPAPAAQDTTGNLSFDGGHVEVYNVTAGDVTYDEATKTLTLNNATVNSIWSDYPLIIDLAGNSTCPDISIVGSKRFLTIEGDGSLEVDDGFLGSHISCKNLTVEGGKVLLGADLGELDSPYDEVKVTGGELLVGSRLHCKKLVVSGGMFSAELYLEPYPIVEVTGGTISTGRTSSCHCASLSVSGGTIDGRVSSDVLKMSGTGKIVCNGDSFDGDAICCDSFDMRGGSVAISNIGSGRNSISINNTFTMTGGSISASGCGLSVGGNFTMTGGKITTSGKNGGVSTSGNFTLNGGTVKATNCDYGLHVASYTDGVRCSATIKKGSLVITNPSHYGVMVYSGDFNMTGGTVSITGAYEYGIQVSSNTYRGKTYGGKVSITGGSLTSTVRKPKDYSAISADSMTNDVSCLKTIAGRLPKGAKFKVGGNTYQRTSEYGYGVILTSYGSKKTKVTLNTAKYGSVAYEICGVGANAFNTKQGKKVKSLTFKNTIYYLGKNAFKNTKSLTSFKASLEVESTWKYRGNKSICTVKKSKAASFAKGSFAGMGKNKGKGLTLKVGSSEEYNAGLRKYLRKLGLPAGVKFGIKR